MSDALSAPHRLEYTYKRSVGPVLSAFFTALRDRRIVGIRARDGRVLVPPQEYDPVTSESLDEIVDVADAGVVTSWAWTAAPSSVQQPLPGAFAWALIRLDGADTALLHTVDAGDEARMRTGMRVAARWRDERKGHMRDIECFVPEASA